MFTAFFLLRAALVGLSFFLFFFLASYMSHLWWIFHFHFHFHFQFLTLFLFILFFNFFVKIYGFSGFDFGCMRSGVLFWHHRQCGA